MPRCEVDPPPRPRTDAPAALLGPIRAPCPLKPQTSTAALTLKTNAMIPGYPLS